MDKLIEKLKEVYRNRNWEETSKELEKILSQFDEYICKPIEYNTDTSIPHSNMSKDIVRTTHITNESVEIRG